MTHSLDYIPEFSSSIRLKECINILEKCDYTVRASTRHTRVERWILCDRVGVIIAWNLTLTELEQKAELALAWKLAELMNKLSPITGSSYHRHRLADCWQKRGIDGAPISIQDRDMPDEYTAVKKEIVWVKGALRG